MHTVKRQKKLSHHLDAHATSRAHHCFANALKGHVPEGVVHTFDLRNLIDVLQCDSPS